MIYDKLNWIHVAHLYTCLQ